MEKGRIFHNDLDAVLFSCYKTKRHESYGDAALYQKYIDTVAHVKKMRGNKISVSEWKRGSFVHTIQKGVTGRRWVTQTHDGKWCGELYEHNEVVIVMLLQKEQYNIALIPINNREYELEKAPAPSVDGIDIYVEDADIMEVQDISDCLTPNTVQYRENSLNAFSDKLLVVLPRLSPHTNRNLRLSKAYVNLVGFLQKRYGMEAHVISSAESYMIVPKLKNVKTVLAVHPADVAFVNHHFMPFNADEQDIIYKDAFAAAEAKTPLKRGLSVKEWTVAATVREKAAVNHIVQKHYEVVVDFENPWNSVYNLKPTAATIYLRVSAHNMTVKGYIGGEPIDDLCSLLMYDGACRPLGSWREEPDDIASDG